MSKAPYMPLFCDAYLGDTMHLSLEENGAYLKLLMVTWRNNGQPLPDDDARLARILGVTVSRWTGKLRPVLVQFFDLSNGTWRQPRLEKEWNFVTKSAAVSRENGMRGGRPNSLKMNETDNPAGSFQVSQIETTQPTPKREDISGGEKRIDPRARPRSPQEALFDAGRSVAMKDRRNR